MLQNNTGAIEPVGLNYNVFDKLNSPEFNLSSFAKATLIGLSAVIFDDNPVQYEQVETDFLRVIDNAEREGILEHQVPLLAILKTITVDTLSANLLELNSQGLVNLTIKGEQGAEGIATVSLSSRAIELLKK